MAISQRKMSDVDFLNSEQLYTIDNQICIHRDKNGEIFSYDKTDPMGYDMRHHESDSLDWTKVRYDRFFPESRCNYIRPLSKPEKHSVIYTAALGIGTLLLWLGIVACSEIYRSFPISSKNSSSHLEQVVSDQDNFSAP